jgi:hypothetical protein
MQSRTQANSLVRFIRRHFAKVRILILVFFLDQKPSVDHENKAVAQPSLPNADESAALITTPQDVSTSPLETDKPTDRVNQSQGQSNTTPSMDAFAVNNLIGVSPSTEDYQRTATECTNVSQGILGELSSGCKFHIPARKVGDDKRDQYGCLISWKQTSLRPMNRLIVTPRMRIKFTLGTIFMMLLILQVNF